MARTRAMCCLMPSKPSGDVARRRSSAACICCIGPHHRPSGGSALAPVDDDHSSVRTPLTSCCGTGGAGDVVRAGRSGARTPKTPKTPCTPSARRLCGVRSRTPRRAQQVRRFPAPEPAPAPAAAVSAVSAAPAAPARTPRTPSTPIGRTQRVCCVTSGGGPAQAGMAKSTSSSTRRRWLSSASKAVAQTTPRNVACAVAGTVRDTTTTTTRPRGNGGDAVKAYTPRVDVVKAAAAEEPAKEKEESVCSNEEYALLCREGFAREDVAAVTIQAYFRAHLARRAFKALKSLVRLQAVARGAYVRRQAEAAVHCMQAMARLQARVRARQATLAKPKVNDGDKLLLQS